MMRAVSLEIAVVGLSALCAMAGEEEEPAVPYPEALGRKGDCSVIAVVSSYD
jgi:hypothetical protein